MACIPSEKSVLGEGWGAWGEGNAPCALAKGVSFPPEEPFHINTRTAGRARQATTQEPYGHRQQR